MAKVKLTAKTLHALKPKPERADYFDASLPGFHVRVTPNGVKTFSVLYRHAGRLRRYTIGNYEPGVLELAKARDKARRVLSAVRDGSDPQAEKKQERTAETFADLAARYIEKWAKQPVHPGGPPRKKSWASDQRIIDSYLLPRFQHTRAKDVRRADVRPFLEEIAADAPIMANRVLACLRKIYNWGISQDLVEANPCTALARPGVEQRRDRVLSGDEIKRVWKAIEGEPLEIGGLFALRLVTAQRGGEVATMRWSDLDGAWWTIPSERSKNKLPHRVPLSAPAVRILERIRAARKESENEAKRDSAFVFPNRRDFSQPIGELQKAAQRIRKAAGVDFRAHDLRRTAASLMTGMGISRLVVSKLLNHAEPGVTSVYDRHGYDAEKREALDAWGRRLQVIVSDLAPVKPKAKARRVK